MTTIGVFNTHADARNAINELRAFGIAESDISYLYLNREGEIADKQTGDKIGDGAATGAATGAVIGALAGLAVAEGVLPGLGSLIVAGPLAAALGLGGAAATTVAGAATGAAAGTLLGVLGNIGVSNEDATLYEQYIRQGDVLVVARSTATDMREVFVRTGAKQIGTYQDHI